MKILLPSYAMALAIGAVISFTGCGKKDTGQATVPAEQLPQATAAAFNNAAPEITEVAQPVLNQAEAKDPNSIMGLQQLSSRPDLTPQQRELVNQYLRNMLEQARAAAAQGDARSDQALQKYRASK